jgi:chemotaxis protein CheY-P-specific phosphatase CheC
MNGVRKMPEISIAQLAAVLRLAMLDDNHDVVKEMQNALMGKTATAILHQDKSELKELLPALASLHAVAGRYMNGKYRLILMENSRRGFPHKRVLHFFHHVVVVVQHSKAEDSG